MTITGQHAQDAAGAVSQTYNALNNLKVAAADAVTRLQADGATQSAANVQSLLDAIDPHLAVIKAEAQAFSEANTLD